MLPVPLVPRGFDGVTGYSSAPPPVDLHLPEFAAAFETNNITQLALYYTQHPVPQRYNPGVIIASIIVAFLGAYSTLLLLSKRTSNKGWQNMFWLVAAAITQVAVGIWGMHFIGMHMSLRPQPGTTWYMRFNDGFTVFSLFVPLISLICAFFFVTVNTVTYVRVVFSGVVAGGTVSLMHYSASFKTNFHVKYKAVYVVFATILACISATAVIFTFFRLRATWTDNWWKRGLCAAAFATGVSSMHYLGMAGTEFYVPKDPRRLHRVLVTSNRQSISTAIAIGCMCGAIVIGNFLLTMSDVLQVQAARERARKIVVCSATFDKQGRLLVKPDGTVPMVVIESEIQPKEMLHYLDRRQPLFQWLYAISWDWAMVLPFVRAIGARFRRQQPGANSIREQGSTLARWLSFIKKTPKKPTECDQEDNTGGGPSSIDLGDFKDRYISAAHELALELNIPMEQVGVLYDRVFPNGSLLYQEQQQAKQKRVKRTRKIAKNAQSSTEAEKPDVSTLGELRHEDDGSSISSGPVSSVFHEEGGDQEGLLLFLVREVGNAYPVDAQQELEYYSEKGYRMTETRFLTKVLSDRLSMPQNEMTEMLNSLKLYAKRGTRPVVQPGGVYVGMFGVRPTTSIYGGLDVLTYGFARHMIPSYRLPDVFQVTPEMRAFMKVLDQMSLDEAMRTCERESIRSGERRQYLNADGVIPADAEEDLIQFQMALFLALDALANAMSFYPRIAQSSRLSAELLEVPSSLDDSTAPAQMILVQAVLPSEDAAAHPYGETSATPDPESVPTETDGNGTPFVFVPYTLFAKAQMMLLRGQQADDFEDEVVAELRRRHPNTLMAGHGSSEYGIDSEDWGGGSTSRHGMRNPLNMLAEATGFGAATPAPVPADTHSARSAGRRSGTTHETSMSARSASASGKPATTLGTGILTGKTSRRQRDRLRNNNPETYELTSRLRLGPEGTSTQGTASAQIAQQWAAREGQAEVIVDDEKSSQHLGNVHVQVQMTPSLIAQSMDNLHTKTDSVGSSTGQQLPFEPSQSQMPVLPLLPAAPQAARSSVRVQIQEADHARPSGPERGTTPAEACTDGTSGKNDVTSGRSGKSGWSNRSARRTLGMGRGPPEVDAPSAVAEPNEASLRARLAADDWSARQLESLGRGPAGPLLLGVDY